MFQTFLLVHRNVTSTRQSRSRFRQKERAIDRETVLKINRHPTRRHRSCVEFQWPPHNESRPHVNTNTQRFDNKTFLSKRQVVEIRQFFDNYERNMNELWGRLSNDNYNKKDLSDNMKTSSKSAENLKFDKHNNFVCGIDKTCQQGENQSCHTLSSSTSNLLHIIASERSSSPRCASVSRPPSSPSPRKCFYLPEEKIHSNELLVKIRQHFDKSHDKQQHSSGICNDDIASNQNKIGKTKNHKHCDEVHRCKNDGVLASPALFNESDQKIFQPNKSTSKVSKNNLGGFNKSAEIISHKPQALEEPLCYRISKQQSALIKNDNAISCGVSNDLKLEWRAQDPTITTSKTHHIAIADELSRVIAVEDEKQKHYHCKDLKPIKSLELATTTIAVRRENEFADDGKQQQEQEPLAENKQQQKQFYQKQVYDERYNSILMNDDCILQQKQQQQMQDEQTSSSDGTCRDKYFKDSKDSSRKMEMLSKSDFEINEISTNNSTSSKESMETCKINKSIENNLNLDLYFDKELSAWSSAMIRKRTNNDIPISDIKLDNETTMANYCNSESSSDPSDDSASTTSSNSESDPYIIGTRSSFNHQPTNSTFPYLHSCTSGDNNRIKTEAYHSDRTENGMCLFTDGTYIYGPYNFDLFTNSFYHFHETKSDEDEASSDLQHHDKRNRINTELLKNHDDINTQSNTVGEDASCVRDVDLTDEISCEKSNNNILNDRVLLNATNDSSEWKSDKNFNYLPSSKEACDYNLIDLMDGGGSYVSKIREEDDRDLHCPPTLTDYVDAACSALLLTAITDAADASVDLNNSEQFNYERDKIVEITDDDDMLAVACTSENSEKYDILSTSHIASTAKCTTAVNEKFSNHEVPKIKILGCDGNCVDGEGRDGAEGEIRFRECERHEMCDKFHSSVNDNCHGNFARDECQG